MESDLSLLNSDSDSNSSTYSRWASEPPTKRHKCTFENCQKSFYRPSKLAEHTRRHTEERPFKCEEPECEKSYHKKDALKRHQQRVHLNQIENIMCPVEGCLQVMRKNSFRKHMLRKHNTFRRSKFHCPECQKGFRSEFELKNHSTEHNGTYKCHICEKEFQQGSRFRWHLKCHKIYSCPCEQEFSNYKEFRAHKANCDYLSVLRPSCKVCHKLFANNHTLNHHYEQMHKGKDPLQTYKCTYEECTREYAQMRNLRKHVKDHHTNEKSNEITEWTCEDCQKVFKAKEYLKKHQKRFHINPVPKIKKPRKPRSDKGIRKIPMITQLTGIDIAKEGVKEIVMNGEALSNKPMEELEMKKQEDLGSEINSLYDIYKVPHSQARRLVEIANPPRKRCTLRIG